MQGYIAHCSGKKRFGDKKLFFRFGLIPAEEAARPKEGTVVKETKGKLAPEYDEMQYLHHSPFGDLFRPLLVLCISVF